jgi:hypothetical protein
LRRYHYNVGVFWSSYFIADCGSKKGRLSAVFKSTANYFRKMALPQVNLLDFVWPETCLDPAPTPVSRAACFNKIFCHLKSRWNYPVK